ncbi:MAG: DUF4097 family beta strand repeat protein [Clostridia bacterium]|nr:DUF4097 family beta strand repeat protein [Clostridia bacterium]
MKKIITVIISTILLALFVGCSKQDAVLDETITYEVTCEIHSLNVQINAADFKIVSADEFLVESNLKYLSVSEENGILKIVDTAKGNSNYHNPILIISVPKDMVFDNVNISTGAAKMTVDNLSANSIELKLGAGDVRFESINASTKADIKGGAGQITVVSGTLNNLSLEMGMGELNLTAAVLGGSNLKFGVGESNVTLIGSKEDYKVNIEKGVGSITVDGNPVTHFCGSEKGQNHIEIEGGVGSINLKFQEN